MSTQSYFDSWSTDLYAGASRFQRTIHLLTGGVVRGETLDLGCGSRVHYDTGAVTRWVGIDVSRAMLDDLQFLGRPPQGPIEKLVGSCMEAPIDPAAFDTVCAMFLLHHLGKDSARVSRTRVLALLARARQALRPGGRLLIAESAARALEWPYHLGFPVLYPLFRRFWAVELPYFWSLPQLLRMSEATGFVEPCVAQLPVFERIVNPVSGIALPGAVTNALQRMTLLVLTRS